MSSKPVTSKHFGRKLQEEEDFDIQTGVNHKNYDIKSDGMS